MKKNSKAKHKALMAPRVDPYLEGLMGKLLERLVSLERKMDAVVAQTSAKSSGANETIHLPKYSPGPQTKEYPRRERVMYETICADCRQACEVPFRPSEGRAIYCKECFAKRRSNGSSNGHSTPNPAALPPKPAEKPTLPPAATAPSKQIKKSPPAKKAKKKK